MSGTVARARPPSRIARERVTLAETLDRVLNKGAVIAGDITISIADVDLLYLGLSVVLCSVETLRELRCGEAGDTGAQAS